MTMSRATADIMRRALQFYCRGILQNHHSTPSVVTSSKLYSVHCLHLPAPRSVCNSGFRHFSDAQINSRPQEFEKPAPTAPETLKHGSVFMNRLSSCSSPSDVLDLTLQSTPTAPQISHCLSQMWNSLKKLSQEQRKAELRLMWEHAAWEPLLQRAVSGVSQLPHTHLAYTLLALVKLGVNPRTRVVQTYLRAAQERINDFDDKSLSILSSCLENMEEGANIRALKHGIRLLVEARLPRIDNVLHLQTMMRLVGKDAPLKLKQRLESKALSLSEQFSLPNAQYMITSMATLGFSSKPLLSVCSSKITEQLSGVPFNPLLTVLVSCRELRFRDLQLLNAVSEHGASMVHVWTHKQVVLILSALESLSFCPRSLLDSYSDLVQSEPEALTLRDLMCLIKACSSLNYHSPSLVSCLSSALEPYAQRMTPLQLLNAQYHLSVMGHFSTALLQALFQETVLQQLRDREAKSVHSQLDVVELCLRLERPELLRSFSIPLPLFYRPPTSPVHASPKAEFSSALRTLMEDREGWSMQEGELLEGYHFIDAVLTRKPTASDLESPVKANSQSLAVLCIPTSAFCFGTSLPRGPLALKLRHLGVLGYLPLLVTEQELLLLPEDQRVDFLRERIFPNDRQRDVSFENLQPLER